MTSSAVSIEYIGLTGGRFLAASGFTASEFVTTA
jgi:hypothetical protein